ncbi:MAG: arylsulfatase [Isosphaeraceae bacterium]
MVLSLGLLAGSTPRTANAVDDLKGRRPNVILIMTDDQGYGDLACHGNPVIKTPHLDALHAGSVRFTDFHVSPTCSPTRSALLTGRHEFKNGVTHTIHERERLTLSATTLPQVLKSAGYATGIFGKWHLGDEDAYQPGRRGYDEVFIHGAGGIGQSYPGSCGDVPRNSYFDPVVRHNGTFKKTQGYCTDVFFKRAEEWIGAVKGNAPFFCEITPNAPHAPLDCPKGSDAPYQGKVPPNVAKFYGMITNIDENVGKLLARLEEWGIEKETLVIFLTDNGSATGSGVFNAGMRGAKGTAWEGGTRVPSFWRWPGTLPAGVDVSALTCHYDVFPTLAELAGAKLDGEVAGQVEGRSLLPLLRDAGSPWADRYFVSHVGRWGTEVDPRVDSQVGRYDQCSVRWRNYHLVSPGKSAEKAWRLYDLTTDPGEQTDVAEKLPEVVARLDGFYDAWWAGIKPLLVNERVKGPDVNPFKAAYWNQYRGPGPNDAPPPSAASQ